MTVLSTNRRACIVLENGVKTGFFDLERGNAQGDTLSPFLLNLGYQVLLMKLKLDLQIEGLIDPVELLESHPLPPSPAPEVSLTPPKANALADNATLLVKMEVGTLMVIRNILQAFEHLSGLGCNVDMYGNCSPTQYVLFTILPYGVYSPSRYMFLQTYYQYLAIKIQYMFIQYMSHIQYVFRDQ